MAGAGRLIILSLQEEKFKILPTFFTKVVVAALIQINLLWPSGGAARNQDLE